MIQSPRFLIISLFVICTFHYDVKAMSQKKANRQLYKALWSEKQNPLRVKAAIDRGADINSQSKKIAEHTPLNFALNHECSNDIVRILVSAEADVNAEKYGLTPLFRSILGERDVEVVSLLVEHGADIDTQWDGQKIDHFIHDDAGARSKAIFEYIKGLRDLQTNLN